MGRFITKMHDYYLEQSTVVDAPVTYGMIIMVDTSDKKKRMKLYCPTCGESFAALRSFNEIKRGKPTLTFCTNCQRTLVVTVRYIWIAGNSDMRIEIGTVVRKEDRVKFTMEMKDD